MIAMTNNLKDIFFDDSFYLGPRARLTINTSSCFSIWVHCML